MGVRLWRTLHKPTDPHGRSDLVSIPRAPALAAERQTCPIASTMIRHKRHLALDDQLVRDRFREQQRHTRAHYFTPCPCRPITPRRHEGPRGLIIGQWDRGAL